MLTRELLHALYWFWLRCS